MYWILRAGFYGLILFIFGLNFRFYLMFFGIFIFGFTICPCANLLYLCIFSFVYYFLSRNLASFSSWRFLLFLFAAALKFPSIPPWFLLINFFSFVGRTIVFLLSYGFAFFLRSNKPFEIFILVSSFAVAIWVWVITFFCLSSSRKS